jgi:hypothetical protein
MIKKISGFLLAAAMTLSIAPAQATVIVTFGGNLSNTNPGPFENTADYSGSFELDTTVTATGANNNYNGAVDNFTVSIFETTGTKTFTGMNGRLQQFSSRSGATDFIQVSLNNGCCGSVSGSTNFTYTDRSTGNPTTGLFTLSSIRLDLRGANLFTDPLQIASNLSTGDFSYRKFTMGFIRPTTGVPIGNWSSINLGGNFNLLTFQGSSQQMGTIPEPGGLSLLLIGLFASFGLRRRVKKARL